MALYKNGNYLKPSDSGDFDKLYSPGTDAPYAGIYRCTVCHHEIGIAFSHKLPPQTHPKHPDGKPIQWQLIVFAQHNDK